ncbi:unnamed protein product [Alopecurus aequalis]
MAGRRRLVSAAAPPLDDDDLFEEILVRLSPLPSSLPRASFVSKRWRALATAPLFHRRFFAHHQKPPILGVFEKYGQKLHFSIIFLFDPISRDCRFVSIPPGFGPRWANPPDLGHYECTVRAAVLCAAGDDQDHVHGDCHMSPFKVAVVGTFCGGRHPAIAILRGPTGIWGDRVSTAEPCTGTVSSLPCTLAGSALYWWLDESQDEILEFDLDSERLALVKRPTFVGIDSSCIRIIRAEGGSVGIAVLAYPSFQMWCRKVSGDGVATWMLQKTGNMHEITGLPSGIETRNAAIVGYSEEAGALFISVSSNSEHYAFIVQLDSMQSRKLNGTFLEKSYHPFTNFYTAGTVEAQSSAPAIEPPQQ